MIKDEIKKKLQGTLEKMGVKDQEGTIEQPANSAFGDYSSSIALKLTKILKKNPFEIAQDIVKNFPKDDIIEKVEAVKPGFINFTISSTYLLKSTQELAQNQFSFPSLSLGPNKKLMIEFAHPNTHKLFHIGHLRNISIGESLVHILEAVGNKVIRSNYQGDVGLHIAKTLWYIKYKITPEDYQNIRNRPLHERMIFLGKSYAEGQRAYDENAKNKEDIIEINRMIYERQGDILSLWKETKNWSLDYFDSVYKRVYSHFDRLYLESEFDKRGIEICREAEKKGILNQSKGALVFAGKPYGLDTRVFINSEGFPTYEGKELALSEKEISDFGNLDKIIHVVTPEQTSFFKVTFKVEELLDKKFKDKQYHLSYEWVKLKTGKMASRTGNIVEGEQLIDQAKQKILEDFKCNPETAEIIAVAAVKYTFLKQSLFAQIAYDVNESVSLEGNSGPYLLYTYVRTLSVLRKTTHSTQKLASPPQSIEPEERDLLKTLIQFPEIVEKAAKEFSPNFIANYLYETAQKFNLFYQKHQILEANEPIRNFRLVLTQATGNVIKQGLYLLGIKTVEKM